MNRKYFPRKRGATLLLTVLITVIAATITLLTIRLLLTSLSEGSAKINYQSNRLELKNVEANIENIINNNPTAVFEYVLPTEAPRICITDNSTYQPGSPWPSYCGFYWQYADSTSDITTHIYFGKNKDVTSPDGSLTFYLKNKKNGAVVGDKISYIPGGRNRVKLFTSGDLNLSSLGSSSLNGTVYATGNIFYPTISEIKDSLIIAGSYSGTLNSNNIYANITGGLDYHNFISNELNSGDLRNLSATLHSYACPTMLNNTPKNISTNGRDYTTSLCISPGASAITASNSIVSVPLGVSSVLIVPANNHKLYVYTNSLASFNPDTYPVSLNSSCDTDCKYDSYNYVTSGMHFGSLNFWTPLGTFNYPTSGLIGTTVTTQIGLCDGEYNGVIGTGFLIPNGVCRTWSGSREGGSIDSNFLVVAGNPNKPIDVYLGGPIYGDSQVGGVISSGDIIIPYWSRPTGGNYTEEIDLSLFSLGRSAYPTLRSYPYSQYGLSTNRSGNLNLKGNLASNNLTTGDLNIFFSSIILNNTYMGYQNNPSLVNLPDLYFSKDFIKKLTLTEVGVEFP